MNNLNDSKYMRQAIALSKVSVEKGGGPFGAVIVKDGKVVARGNNLVTRKNDPTAHAEVSAIRLACKKLNTFDLTGCTIYTSCEPCPMCLSAIYWAHIDKIYYGCTQLDAKKIDFDDSFIYDQIALRPEQRSIPSENILNQEAVAAFEMWQAKEDRVKY
jgi:tRNA(Arg) A34 adenosine deaminase TadA